MNVRHIFLILLIFLFGAPSTAATCSPPDWGEECFRKTSSGQQLKPQYLKRVKFEKNGFAVLYVDVNDGPRDIVAINRKGEVVVSGIVDGDPDFRDAEGGLAAFYVRQRKAGGENQSTCGYVQLANFKVAIPPTYTICGHFYQKTAYVCVNCKLDCGDCHSYEYFGDEAFVINTKNEILRRTKLPKIPRCSTVEATGGFPKDQPCRPGR